MLTGCSSRALREAQEVVAQADSLRAEGVAYTDSMALAEAYNTLEKWQYLYPTDYARACYYYGRLLRNNDDPVAAMQVFINGTHSNTRDYHILGRTYSNMGSICHLANEFQLSYDMYSRSANMFLKNGDTLLYYYLLNDMAVELAVQKEENKTYNILTMVRQYDNKQLHIKTCETEALLSQYIGNYERVIHIVDSIQELGYNDVLGDVLKARAYSYLNQPDSALYYVHKVMPRTQEPAYLVDVYYIFSHDDKTLPKDSILALTSQRADIQKIWGQGQGNFAQAVQLLEQDLHRRPNLIWLYAIVATLIIVGSILLVYRKYQKRRHNLIKQHIANLQEKAYKTQELHDVLQNEVSNIRENKLYQLEQTCEALRTSNDLAKELKWKDFDGMSEMIDTQFYLFSSKLRKQNLLNEQEIRLCILVLLDLSRNQMADMLNYSQNGIGKFKYRTAQKLSTEGKNLRTYLINIAIGTPINGK